MLLQRQPTNLPLPSVVMAAKLQCRADTARVRAKEPPAESKRRSSMVERLEHALMLVAYIVLRHGPVYAPYIDRLERELEAARQNDPTERAKRILETYAANGNTDAARLGCSWLEEKNAPASAGGAGHHGEQPSRLKHKVSFQSEAHPQG
jgi:hypothetical protein